MKPAATPGGPLCLAVELRPADAIDAASVDVDVVHLGEARSSVTETASAGVRSVPARSSADSRFTSTSALRSPT